MHPSEQKKCNGRGSAPNVRIINHQALGKGRNKGLKGKRSTKKRKK